MNKSQRVYLNTGNTLSDKYIKFNLEQEIDTLEFLSMSIDAKDIYQSFNSDYGVLVGRVTANGGVGIPNAKISIFIPLADEDINNTEITSIYPYTTPLDKNVDGKRYNLLPRVSKYNQTTNQWSPKQPFGSFPIKEEIVTNVNFLDVYKKYYKYSTVTNNAGDYMIFGVPIGTQTVHLSADITDIGKYSMNPAAMVVNLGYSSNLFTSDNTRIKPSSDLNDLPNIETQEISVDVIPFWGDTTNFEIGITRQDFRIRAMLMNTFTIFGSVFTDGEDRVWGTNIDSDVLNTDRNIRELYRAKDNAWSTLSISAKRTATVTEKIYYYPYDVSNSDIESGNTDANGDDMILLDPAYYTVHKKDGDIVFIINCNRHKIITDELGKEMKVDDDSPNGVFTEFRGFITLEITDENAPMSPAGDIGKGTSLTPYRYKLKFPQYADSGRGFNMVGGLETAEADTIAWRKQNYVFNSGKFYSFSRFHGTTYNKETNNNIQANDALGFLVPDKINRTIVDVDPFFNVGIITTSDIDVYFNNDYKFPSNSVDGDNVKYFGADWMNLCIHLPQLTYVDNGYDFIRHIRTADNFAVQIPSSSESTINDYYLTDNQQKIAGNERNTKGFARSDLHWTDIIEVPITDIILMNDKEKGFIDDPTTGATFTGKYRNGTDIPANWLAPCPLRNGVANSVGGKIGGNPSASSSKINYFYKGFGKSDCIQYLFELGLIN